MVDRLAVARQPRRPVQSPPVPIAGHAVEQSCGRSRRHSSHSPHEGAHESATWSPAATRVTPGPTASTTPAPSWPSTAGHGVSAVPSTAFWSEWQTPLTPRAGQAPRRPAGRARSRSVTCWRPPVSSRTAARILKRAPRSRRSAAACAELLDRDVATHQVRVLDLDERRLRLARRSAPSFRGQRVWKTQPRRRRGRARDVALEPDALAPAAVDRRHRREKRLGVRVVRPVEDDVSGAELHHAAEVEDGDPVGEVAHDAEVVRDEEVRDPARACSSTSRLRIAAWTETSSAEVGSSQTTSFGSPANARAIATRCLSPPESCAGCAASVALGEPDRRISSCESRARPQRR